MFTTAEVAKQLGRPERSVRRAAERAKVGTKVGRDWVFSARDIPKLQAAMHAGPGQPRKD